MSSYEAVTPGQLNHVKKLARDKGVGRALFQYGLDRGIFAAALDEAKQKYLASLVPPSGGRIHILCTSVVLDREWQDAVSTAGPDTPANDEVRMIGNEYWPTGKGAISQEMVLVSGPNLDFVTALRWAEPYSLRTTAPRMVFAVGEHDPDFPRKLGVVIGAGNDPMLVVATDSHLAFYGYHCHEACVVCWRWDGTRVVTTMLTAPGGGGGPAYWFAFRLPA